MLLKRTEEDLYYITCIQEGQVALNRSPGLYIYIYICRYLLKAGYVPGDTWGRTTFGPKGIT